MEDLRAPLKYPRLLHLRCVHADQLMRFTFEEIEPRDYRAVGAFGERGDILGRQDGVTSETLEDLNIAGDVGPYGYDLSIALNWIG